MKEVSESKIKWNNGDIRRTKNVTVLLLDALANDVHLRAWQKVADPV